MMSAELKNVTYTYPLCQKPAFRNISCRFEEGRLYGITGPNGSGKSTLCSLLKGLIPSFYRGKLEGEVILRGKKLEEWDASVLARQIGYIFQNPFTQISGIKETVFEEVAVGLENLGVPKDAMIERAVEVIRLLGIEDLLEKNPNTLSGGQRQRVAFASIVAMDNDFLIIDEPTSQLDPEGTVMVFNIINTLKRMGKTIVLVEHKIDLLAEYADEMLVMHEGTVLTHGPTQRVLEDFALLDKGVMLPQTALLAKRFADVGQPMLGVPITIDAARKMLGEVLAREPD